MNLKKFIISSDAQISFVLKKGTEEVLSQRYDPDSQGRIEIDMRDVVHAQLSFDFRGSAVRTYEQTNLHAEFTAEIDGQAVNFHAVRGGVDNLADTATNFLTQNWLTWQPTVKPVTYYTPEFLTYYAPVAGVVKLRGYFVGDDGQVTSQKDIELCNVEAEKAYTIPVEYQVVVSLLYPDGKPGYYDVWVENASGERLTYIQRYYADAMRSISEDWVLFENSLGGVDCFRAYGKTNLEADHTHNLAEVDEMSEEYRVDTERKYEKNTGHLSKDEARWLLDFFPSQKKYIYVGSYLRQIVVVESNVTGNLRELPTNYTFTYKYADARPLLNLPRTDVPADMLDITIPEVGNFTIPPRLAEVPRLPLSEGDLFPVQNPYSETWSTTTAGALAEVVGQLLAAAAGTGGGVGHTHKNIDLLNLLSYVEEYLLVNGKKIKAGYADTAGSVAEGKYIRKDQPDETNYLLKLLGGVLVDGLARFGDFITGVSGAMIDKNGDAEFRSIYARKRIFTPEVAYNRVTYIKGKFIISPGGGCTVDTVTDNGDGTYTIKPDLTDADGLSQFKDDILTTYFVIRNEEGKLNGFEEMKFRVMSADFSAKTFVLASQPGHDWVPVENMVLAQTGNFIDPDRQTYTIIDVTNGNNCITFFEHANTWDPEPAQMPGWLGKKKGMVINGINCDNYSAVLQQVLITGLIFQIDEITGESVRVPIWKGEWVKDKKYGYFNEVSHKGSRYLCINPEGTEEEPGTGQDWLITVEKGQQGDPGLSVVGGGHWESSKTPYEANTLVSFYNCVFISNVKTSNPPIAIARFKDGSYIRQKNGGYILAGRSADFTVHPDWTMLLDGRELKGTSITFLGSFATAPSNPVEGNSYYNTTDKCTYIYQNGQWMLMVSDGKDGRDYEYIYTRNNSIGITPDKPDSKQQDDYVPEGWTDDYLGVSETFQVEWGCKRTKRDGVWSEWSEPAIVHRWSKDGENAVIADLDNEMVNCALTSDGKTSKAQSWVTNVAIWYGYESLPLESISTTQPSGITVSANKNTGAVTVSVAENVALTETNDVIITLSASKNGQNFERQLTFTIAGVRAGADGSDGADAVLYSLVPSVSSVAKYKDGTYSASTVSCKRQKAVGDSIADTTDGELKYSRDGGVETNYTDGTAIATTSFTRSIKFLFYVGGKLVDVETIPMLSDGHDGQDGSSIEAVGHWEASQVPYAVNKLVNFGRGTFVALQETSEPPLPIARFKDGTYMRKKDGGYILAGRSADMTVNPSWRMMSWNDESETLYWLDCPISAFSYTSTGSPSPSSVEVTCKMSRGGSVSDCVTLWLAARRYNGSWVAHVGATQSSKIAVPATAGYTQFVVRAYKSSSDASAWNSNYVAERGIGVAQAGKDGTDYEYIFQRTTTNSCPSTPATAQQDDYVPSGWTPDPQGVSDTYPYEWASMRTKNDGTWGAFCRPYPFGVKGETGATGAFPYDRGVFKSGQSYVWNSVRRDKVIHLIGGVYYNFLVKNYGATVTAAPTSASGDSNWEAMQKFESIVTDTFFADGANIGGFMFKLKGYTSDGIPYGELRSQQADGNGTPNFYVDTQTGKVYACVAEIKGTIEASSGKIGGLQISGNSLTNINGNNDAGIYLRNSTEGTFAAMGGNVVPSVGGFTMIADLENTKRYDLTDISSINYGLKLLAQNARTNIALTIDGGCVQGFAMRNTFINTGVTSRTLTRNDYNVICNNTNECTLTLPSMQLYDDGHVVRIKRLNGNVLVKTSYCYVIDPETYTSKYVRPIIIYSDSKAVTGSSSNNLTMNTKGDGTELVWVRDYIGTVNGTTYYGAWIANKVSYM